VHSALLELLNEKEVQAVLAHELGHLKSEHGVYITMANLLLALSSSLLNNTLGRALAELGNLQILRWLRAAELTCDRAALLVVQDDKVVIGALMKLAGGSPSYASSMDVDAYLDQATSFDEAADSRLGRLIAQGMTEGLTHPLPVLRVRELRRWSLSNHYKTLVANHGRPFMVEKNDKEAVDHGQP
jgi:Zn-dependent protease with chaperone function